MNIDQVDNLIRRTRHIPGWFDTRAYHLFALLNRVQAAHGVSGNLFEIGVWRGKSAILLAAMRNNVSERLGVCDPFVSGVDIFPSQDQFINEFRRFYADDSFLDVFVKRSDELTHDEVTRQCRFMHIDGGHSSNDVYADMELASATVIEQGVVVLDDFLFERWPGVSDGCYRFQHDHPGRFVPLVIGFNKLVLIHPAAAPMFEPSFQDQDNLKPFLHRDKYVMKKDSLMGRDIAVFHDYPPPDAAMLGGVTVTLVNRFPWLRNRHTRRLNRFLKRMARRGG